MAKKKVCDFDREERLEILLQSPDNVPISKKLALLNLSAQSYYYQKRGESFENLTLMRLLDEQYLKTPFYGVLRMQNYLQSLGYQVNSKRVRRLLRKMGLEAIYPKPNLSKAAEGHEIYPYLLRNFQLSKINEVWSCDITYVPMNQGFMYCFAVMDWYSRYVLNWEISNSLDGIFCRQGLEKALSIYGKPKIFNSDQGSQFTSKKFTKILQSADIQISMDGRGRALDNVFIERLWRSLKYEYVYLHAPATGKALWEGLKKWFDFYNLERGHQSLNYQTPWQIYQEGL